MKRKTIPVVAALLICAALLACSALLVPVSTAQALPGQDVASATLSLPPADPEQNDDPAPLAGIAADDLLIAQGPPPPPPPPPAHPFPPPPPRPGPPVPPFHPPAPHPVPPVPPAHYPYYPYPNVWPWCDTCRWYVNPRPITQVVYVQVPQEPACPPIQCSAPVIVSFTSVPNCVQSCQSSTLSWTVNNATSVSIYPTVGSVASSGSYVVTPVSTTTYTLTASNSYGNVTGSTTVTVTPLPITTTYSTTSSPATSSATTTSVVTSGPSSGSNPFSNLWLMSLLLIGLVAIAAVATVLIITRRRPTVPAAAMAGTVAAARTTGVATLPATGTAPRTSAIAPALQAKFLTEKGESVLLPASGVIGRNELQSVLPPNKADLVSRQHIRVDYENGQYFIEDSGSTNGTRLNGQAIKGSGRHAIKNGDTVDMAGAVSLAFQT